MTDLVFSIHRSDLAQAVSELEANRSQGYRKTDLVQLFVMENAGTFRAVGTECTFAAQGPVLGAAEMPMLVLANAVKMNAAPGPLDVRIEPGVLACGKCVIRHERIQVGAVPDVRHRMPLDASAFDCLVIAHSLRDGGEQTWLSTRMIHAKIEMSDDISASLSYLEKYGIHESEIRNLINQAVEKAEPRIKKALAE